jgi:hypothetical protein
MTLEQIEELKAAVETMELNSKDDSLDAAACDVCCFLMFGAGKG